MFETDAKCHCQRAIVSVACGSAVRSPLLDLKGRGILPLSIVARHVYMILDQNPTFGSYIKVNWPDLDVVVSRFQSAGNCLRFFAQPVRPSG
jgi:hypothetical protein